jgi:hypothetical protein
MLNKYGGYSFTAMRGFGDVAILALVKAFNDNFGKPQQVSLGIFGDGADEDVTVLTEDRGQAKRHKNEFGDSVRVLASKEL